MLLAGRMPAPSRRKSQDRAIISSAHADEAAADRRSAAEAERYLNMVMYRIYYDVMVKINIAEAKARLSAVLESVERGETVVLCRRNVPIAEIRALPGLPAAERPVGIDRGMKIPDSFFEPLPDELLRAFGARGEPS